MAEPDEGDGPAGPAAPGSAYRRLPARVRLEDTVASQEATPPPGPDEATDSERAFMLRYAN
jgi:hypothetical protein